MIFWRFVLNADDRLNLADADAGCEWFVSQPWQPQPVSLKWDANASAIWSQNVAALRSIARRLGSVRPKRVSSIVPDMADAIFQRYVAKLAVMIRREGERPLTNKTIRGVALLPSMLRGGDRIPANGQLRDPDVFWQTVFGSFVAPGIALICESCGRDLPSTKQGKPSRRERCPACNWRDWRSKQPAKRMRAKWRADNLKQSRAQP